MAHQIEQMAYVGATPWHGLGNNLPQKLPIEVWQREAGMNWQILDSPVHFKSDEAGHLAAIHSFHEQNLIFRPDTKAPLSVDSPRRSEEHTSELQSLMRTSYAVFCLKKKTHKQS